MACTTAGGACRAAQNPRGGFFGSPILPLGVLCALVCSLLGYVAFLYLHRREEEKARQLEEVERQWKAVAGGGVGVAWNPAAEVAPREGGGVRNPTPAPGTPRAVAGAPGTGVGERNLGEDGSSSIQIERVSSSLIIVRPPPLLTPLFLHCNTHKSSSQVHVSQWNRRHTG